MLFSSMDVRAHTHTHMYIYIQSKNRFKIIIIKSIANMRKIIFVCFVCMISGEEICIPGSIFKKGCEMCTCSPDGQILSCVPISCKNLKF